MHVHVILIQLMTWKFTNSIKNVNGFIYGFLEYQLLYQLKFLNIRSRHDYFKNLLSWPQKNIYGKLMNNKYTHAWRANI